MAQRPKLPDDVRVNDRRTPVMADIAHALAKDPSKLEAPPVEILSLGRDDDLVGRRLLDRFQITIEVMHERGVLVIQRTADGIAHQAVPDISKRVSRAQT